ncbi:hypothetical protein A3860_38590 [Niastella vici]|uniref:Secretion system C-terminal sorting domain-containing protein n=1 Tax=Niastella vici TaxID=1703345 RepID=A0A1V9FL97_9BACT|nr:discoidin domain-containing protein [Niastella vici]OQP59149.1 hypothetical protein A3860_38590 [Niastella vici]
MRYLYHNHFGTACITALLLITNITGMNPASGQIPPEDSKAGYVPPNMGKIMPNENFNDPRQQTRFAYEPGNSETRLPNPVSMRDLIIMPSANDGIVLQWRTTWEPGNLKLYEIEFSTDGMNFQRVGVLAAGNYLNGKQYEFRHYPVNVHDRLFYRIRMADASGRYDYSPILSLAATWNTQNYVFPTLINTGMVSVYLNDSFKMLQVVTSDGRILQTQLLNGKTGRIDVSLNSSLAPGICYVRLVGDNRSRDFVQKVFVQ